MKEPSSLRVPHRTRRWISARSARHADVFVSKEEAQVIGTSQTLDYSECVFGLAVGPAGIVYAVAPPVGSSAPWHGELLRYQTPATVTGLVKRFNATIGRDGTISLG